MTACAGGSAVALAGVGGITHGAHGAFPAGVAGSPGSEPGDRLLLRPDARLDFQRLSGVGAAGTGVPPNPAVSAEAPAPLSVAALRLKAEATLTAWPAPVDDHAAARAPGAGGSAAAAGAARGMTEGGAPAGLLAQGRLDPRDAARRRLAAVPVASLRVTLRQLNCELSGAMRRPAWMQVALGLDGRMPPTGLGRGAGDCHPAR